MFCPLGGACQLILFTRYIGRNQGVVGQVFYPEGQRVLTAKLRFGGELECFLWLGLLLYPLARWNKWTTLIQLEDRLQALLFISYSKSKSSISSNSR